MGYIHWPDDNETLYYRDLVLHVNDLREFIHAQVEPPPSQLQGLPSSTLARMVVPTIQARDLRSYATNASNQWNFLQDPRNQTFLRSNDRWILQQVLQQDWFQVEFLGFDHQSQVS
jgi:hypothetical protein